MEIISRDIARDQGLTTYFTGKPCKEGHIAERKVYSGSCCECSRLWTRRWRENGKVPQTTYNPKGKDLPDKEYLDECFIYQEGNLFWKERPIEHFKTKRAYSMFNKRYASCIAGHVHKSNKYTEVRLNNKLYKVHRIIFKMFTGRDPVALIDHIDGDPTNNKFENLREATQQENSRNMRVTGKGSSCYKGVLKDGEYWLSSICINDKPYILKFDNEIDAAKDYDKRAKEHFGEFAKLNFN